MSKFPIKNDFDKRSIELVDTYGWAVTFVAPSVDDPEHTPEFLYTTNLDEHCGLPELIIFGLPQQTAHEIVTDVVALAENGWTWSGESEQLSEIICDFPVELRKVDTSHFDDHFGASISFRNVTGKNQLDRAAQLFWPDSDGRMPWEQPEGAVWYQPRLDIPITKMIEEGLL